MLGFGSCGAHVGSREKGAVVRRLSLEERKIHAAANLLSGEERSEDI